MSTPALPEMKRPRLLARAARAGANLYRRDRDLPASIARAAKGAALVNVLMAAEAACDADRRAGSPSYDATNHVRLLSALLVEAARIAL